MNAMFFMSMISLMDMAMNPAENAMAESHGDTHSVADNNNNSKHDAKVLFRLVSVFTKVLTQTRDCKVQK
jgi:hypothetical protein